ncbi:MAG: class I SAM-dependent methyltransferase [Spirochaetales bacterium]|nr:class I SAM-dependent methyltransferase [Spirochaetales bacterium]
MNYGYAADPAESQTLLLDKRDESNRYFIQLYNHVARGVLLKDRDVLEIGSGRGGGVDYISRYLEPRSIVGMDLSQKAINFCNKNYSPSLISFVNGNAEFLPFKQESFDVVMNIESSHCYSSMKNFLNEVCRVLKFKGYFLFADLRDKDEIDILHSQLKDSQLKLIQHGDITGNIINALQLDSQNRMNYFKKFIPSFLLDSFQEFAGTINSRIYKRFINKKTLYLSYLMQKI